MGRSLFHRGPDGDGSWIDDGQVIGLTYRRLAVIDPSAAGRQPVLTPSGRYVLIYNGEIYNHLELRGRIERETGFAGWRGHSDTETLAVAIHFWGMYATLGRLEGMFAFACWDREQRGL